MGRRKSGKNRNAGEELDNISTEEDLSINEHELEYAVLNVLELITIREREIIKFRYGIDGRHKYSRRRIGEMFAITGQRVLQIEARVIWKLRQPIRSKHLEGFLDGIDED